MSPSEVEEMALMLGHGHTFLSFRKLAIDNRAKQSEHLLPKLTKSDMMSYFKGTIARMLGAVELSLETETKLEALIDELLDEIKIEREKRISETF